MTVRVYRSTDASAPSLTGQVGSLVAVLDACLVNGYGTQTAAGWTKAFTAANKAGYKQNLTGANNASGMYLYIDDTGNIAGSAAKECSVSGFEVLTAITPTGTGQFPATAQATSGLLVIRKSFTADATARAWTIVANGQTIYMFIESGDQVTPLGALSWMFGDFKSYKTADPYAVMLMARQTANVASSSAFEPMQILSPGSGQQMSLNSKMFGHYLARSWTGVGGSVNFGKTTDYGKLGPVFGGWTSDAGTSCGTNQNFTFGRNASAFPLMTPNGPDGALIVAPVYVFHNFALRGYLSGLWCPLQDRPFAHNDTLTVAAGNMNGKTLLCQQIGADINNSATNDYGQVLVETSDTWS